LGFRQLIMFLRLRELTGNTDVDIYVWTQQKTDDGGLDEVEGGKNKENNDNNYYYYYSYYYYYYYCYSTFINADGDYDDYGAEDYDNEGCTALRDRTD